MVGFETPVPKYVKPYKTTSGDFDFTEVDDMLSRDYTQGSIIQMVRNITPVGASAQQVIVTDGTDTIRINSNGSLNTNPSLIGSSETLFCTNRINGTGAMQTLFTATAGKTAYVTSILVYGTAAGAANIYKHDAATVIASIGIPAANTSINYTGGVKPICSVTGGETLKQNSTANFYVTVSYIEV